MFYVECNAPKYFLTNIREAACGSDLFVSSAK